MQDSGGFGAISGDVRHKTRLPHSANSPFNIPLVPRSVAKNAATSRYTVATPSQFTLGVWVPSYLLTTTTDTYSLAKASNSTRNPLTMGGLAPGKTRNRPPLLCRFFFVLAVGMFPFCSPLLSVLHSRIGHATLFTISSFGPGANAMRHCRLTQGKARGHAIFVQSAASTTSQTGLPNGLWPAQTHLSHVPALPRLDGPARDQPVPARGGNAELI